MHDPADETDAPGPDPDHQPRRGGGPRTGLLGILGTIAILYGVLLLAFSCFMVTNSACHTEAEGRALIPLLLGGALLTWALVRANQARR